MKSHELNLDNYFTLKVCGRAQFLHLLWTFCQDLDLQVALTGRKKPVLGQKKATNNFFDADHHFEPHKIGFKNFDQQSDIPKRGL